MRTKGEDARQPAKPKSPAASSAEKERDELRETVHAANEISATLQDEWLRAERLAGMLQDERDTLRVTMENTEAQLAYLDPDFRFVMVNRAYEQACDRSREELVGRSYFELFPDEERREIFEGVKASGEAAEFKARPLRRGAEAETTYWDWTLTPVKDVQENVRGFVFSLVDVTQTVTAARLSDAINKIDAAILSMRDPEQILQYVASEAARAVGCDCSRLVWREGESWLVKHVQGTGKDWAGKRMTDAQAAHLVFAERAREPVVINDAYRDERTNRQVMRRQGIRSVLVTPLFVRGRVAGTLSFIHQAARRTFSETQLDFARKLSTSVSLAMESSQLYGSLRNELSRTELLRQIALASTRAPNLEGVATGMLSVLATQLQAKSGDVRVLEKKPKRLRTISSFGYSDRTLQPMSDSGANESSLLPARVLRRRRLVTHEDDAKTPDRLRLLKDVGLEGCRYFVAPLFYRGQIVGTFSLAFEGRRPFVPQEITLFAAIANVMTQAVENAQLYEAEVEAQRRAQYELDLSNLVLEASSALTSSLELDDILSSLTEIILKALDRKRVTIDFLDRTSNELVVMAARGTRRARPGDRIEVSALSPKVQRIFRRKKALVLDTASDAASLPLTEQQQETAVLNVLMVPLIAGKTVIGLVTVDEPGENKPFNPREVSLLEGLASQAAIAIENARLHEESIAKARGLEAVSQMGSLITSNLSFEAAKEQIIDYSAVLLGATSSLLLTFDEENEVFRVAAADGVPSKVRKKVLPLEAVLKLGLDSTPTAEIEDLSIVSSIPFFAANLKQGFVSAITAPILIDNKLEGLIVIQDRQKLAASEQDLAAFRLFANQAATALKNARLYEEERRIAEILQQQLMQDLHEVPGLEVGAAYKAAFQAEQVGGDFYDVFELEHDVVAVLIGDVSGKGIRAAGLTETIRSSTRTLAYIDPSPSFVFSRLNHSLLRQTSQEMYATAILLVINVRTGDIRVSNAGHPFPILCGAECQYLKTPIDTLLGAFQQPYREMYFKIDSDQSILMYTDGITEARSGSSFFGDRRLLRTVAACEADGPQGLVDDVLQAASGFAGGKLADDVAVLALRLPRQER